MRVLVVIVAFLGLAVSARAAVPSAHGPTAPVTVPQAICRVFGPYCSQALRVAWCESRFQLDARNGQYAGLFQMGSRERATYGGRLDAVGAAEAAYRYFRATGSTWAPWSCKP